MYKIDLEQEAIKIEDGFNTILDAWQSERKTEESIKEVRRAFDLAVKAHNNVRRKSGEPYIYHPIAVAVITAKELGLGKTSIICALLHDVVEDTDYTLDYIKEEFGQKVADIVDGLTKISDVSFNNSNVSSQSETFRKILLSFAYDIRVILIKLADRLHNMRTLEFMPREKQIKIASETQYIYSSLAHRLGYYNIKSELEDLSLKYLEPEVYYMLDAKIKDKKKGYQRFINEFIYPVKNDLSQQGFKYDIAARFKTVFSIWEKMSEKKVDFDDIDDLFAIRIIIDSPRSLEKFDCWKVYAIVTEYYNPKADRLRDWISTPKANGYESLHATVMSKTGQWVEVQIRSRRMDDLDENGLAAHWRYKDNVDTQSKLDQWINKMKELINNNSVEVLDNDATTFVDDFKNNLFTDEIFVFTPQGELRTLPKGASVLDFAYAVHTELGDNCIGAKINNKLAAINTILRNGDQIEVLNSKKQKPKEAWLDIAITQRAKNRIRTSLNLQKKEHFEEGKQLTEAWLKQYNLSTDNDNIDVLLNNTQSDSLIDLYYKVAVGKLNLDDYKHCFGLQDKVRWYSFLNFGKNKSDKQIKDIISTQTNSDPRSLVLDENLDNVKYTLCSRCNPIHGDDVIGLIGSGNNIMIHRTNCEEAIKLMSRYGNKIVKTKWRKDDTTVSFLAGIELNGIDRKGLLVDLTTLICNTFNINMRNISIQASDGIFSGQITLYVKDSNSLNKLIAEIKHIDGIRSVVRINRSE
jgi:GTP diphosphokinase / guanosine-3',5'-bis(diphosphate) 3'-diphosphatase